MYRFNCLVEPTGADSWFCVQIIDVQPNAKATTAAAGHEGQEDLMGMPVEALLGMDMAHPNVVQTYRHTSLPSSVSCLPMNNSATTACTDTSCRACIVHGANLLGG